MIFVIEVENGDEFHYGFMNKAAMNGTGLTQRALGRCILDVYPEEMAAFLIGQYKKVLSEKSSVKYQDSYTDAYDGAALIPRVAANGTVNINNLAVDKAYVNYTSVAAAFVGYAQSGSTVNISGCCAGSDVTLNANYAGVFRGSARCNR